MTSPLTEAEILAAHVGDDPAHNSTITLAEYDPEWPRLFEREARRLRSLLGDTLVLAEHAGSTSVPGLAAKPIIDMVVAVADSADEAAYVPRLEAAGYRLSVREPEWFEHRLFKGPDTNINLHVFSPGCSEIDRMVRFRDHLRTHDEDRELYERTKRELARRTWKYVQNYADAKTEVIQEIMRRAGG
ncbi:GrpB family protein [Allokutzneria sp. A3M-2-11 16]|uniref:GrpB family protein n=1 Tax=Allokutzneria sp. A3M-2-11 16 TaxID=2962043 RepID=UPI0020B7F60C|nr:GrpB family protein [Allokutzneria sp. A3M-2-11 16]MCP3803676.1 GrpB family protein [Allokutzneria sp. A3M-2-11 16]